VSHSKIAPEERAGGLRPSHHPRRELAGRPSAADRSRRVEQLRQATCRPRRSRLDRLADVGREPGYELTGRDEEGPSLGWHRGEINVSGETIEYLPDLVAIAADLHANVVGDDGEHYTAEGPV
jgi:hypothetical protein